MRWWSDQTRTVSSSDKRKTADSNEGRLRDVEPAMPIRLEMSLQTLVLLRGRKRPKILHRRTRDPQLSYTSWTGSLSPSHRNAVLRIA